MGLTHFSPHKHARTLTRRSSRALARHTRTKYPIFLLKAHLSLSAIVLELEKPIKN